MKAPDLPISLHDLFENIKLAAAFYGTELKEKVEKEANIKIDIEEKFEWTDEEAIVLLSYLNDYENKYNANKDYVLDTARLFIETFPRREIPEELVEWSKKMIFDVTEEDGEIDFEWIFNDKNLDMFTAGMDLARKILKVEKRKLVKKKKPTKKKTTKNPKKKKKKD